MNNHYMLALFLLILGLMVFTITGETLSQVNVLVQIIYSILTFLLVFFSLENIKTVNKQRQDLVRPILVVEIDWSRGKTYDIDFEIENIGSGLALNIAFEVYCNSQKIFSGSCLRLQSTNNSDINYHLSDIYNAIKSIQNEGENNRFYKPYFTPSITGEIPLGNSKEELLNYKNIDFFIDYESILRCHYRTKASFQWNSQEDEYMLLNETIEEIK
ncbi:hypothetical protein [Desulforamulus ruminis]|uniref:hypothetical protein n=1 Tax=Desulforamulus ruminis TaxID=1564 RepID=UPI00235573B0|nr:hypothetical protein [Desulforamulus ruminis]